MNLIVSVQINTTLIAVIIACFFIFIFSVQKRSRIYITWTASSVCTHCTRTANQLSINDSIPASACVRQYGCYASLSLTIKQSKPVTAHIINWKCTARINERTIQNNNIVLLNSTYKVQLLCLQQFMSISVLFCAYALNARSN